MPDKMTKEASALDVVVVEKKASEKEKPADEAVSFRELIRTADFLDWVLMFFGTVCAFATGAVQPWCDGSYAHELSLVWNSPLRYLCAALRSSVRYTRDEP